MSNRIFSSPKQSGTYGWASDDLVILGVVDLIHLLVFQDVLYEGLGLKEWRDAVVMPDIATARIIGRQSEPGISIESVEQFLEISYSPGDVIFGIEYILDAKGFSGKGHQLHQTAGTFF